MTTQYRMHEAIMGFSSEAFYESSLAADSSVREHVLKDLPDVQSFPLTSTPLTFIDTAGAGYDEEMEPAYEGYCGAASEAYLHLAGGKDSGLRVMRHGRGDGSHWWHAQGDLTR